MIIGKTVSLPKKYDVYKGEDLYMFNVEVEGRIFEILTYLTSIPEKFPERVESRGNIFTYRKNGRLHTFFLAVLIQEASDLDPDTSDMEIEGSLIKLDELQTDKKTLRTFCQGIIEVRDGYGRRNFVHFHANGRRARLILETPLHTTIRCNGTFNRKRHTYSYYVRSFE